jgi:FMN reductase
MRIAVIVGNPKPQSRTLLVAEATASALAAACGEAAELTTIDLAVHASHLFDWEASVIGELTASVASHPVAVFASPTYKATYTGLLKAFLDRYGNNGLAGVAAVPVMVGASPIHALAPEVYLRPLLVELGATVPSRGLFVIESQLEGIGEVTASWAATAAPLIRAVTAG